MRGPLNVVAPEIASVGQSNTAYFQRFMVISLGLTSCAISYFNWSRDCRVFKVVTDTSIGSIDDESNVSETIAIIFEDLVGADSIANKTLLADDFVEKYGAVAFGGHSFKLKDLNEKQSDSEQCIEYDEAFVLDPDEDFHYSLIGILAFLTPILGLAGVFCASIEMLFLVFYPSVILGSIFLSLAACTELVWLLMFTVDLRYCFSDSFCSFDVNFYSYCLVVVGFFFSSCLLIFGLRTYPWCFRHRRTPTNCPVVEAKELTEEEILQEYHRWRSGSKSLESEEETIEFYDGTIKPETMKSYQELKHKLNETNLKLFRSREACRKAIARAEKAESLLETYCRTRSNPDTSTSDNINTNNKEKIPIVVFEDKEDEDDGDENTEPLEDDEEDDSIVQLSLSSQISLISERAERLSIMRISVANKESSSSGDDSLDDDKIDDMFQDLDGNNEQEVQTFTNEIKGDG